MLPNLGNTGSQFEELLVPKGSTNASQPWEWRGLAKHLCQTSPPQHPQHSTFARHGRQWLAACTAPCTAPLPDLATALRTAACTAPCTLHSTLYPDTALRHPAQHLSQTSPPHSEQQPVQHAAQYLCQTCTAPHHRTRLHCTLHSTFARPRHRTPTAACILHSTFATALRTAVHQTPSLLRTLRHLCQISPAVSSSLTTPTAPCTAPFPDFAADTSGFSSLHSTLHTTLSRPLHRTLDSTLHSPCTGLRHSAPTALLDHAGQHPAQPLCQTSPPHSGTAPCTALPDLAIAHWTAACCTAPCTAPLPDFATKFATEDLTFEK